MKKLIARTASFGGFLCVGMLSQAALAQSSVTIYGIIDQGINYISNAQALNSAGARVGKTQWTTSSTVMAGNQLGFLGTEDLGGGYKAIFRIETGFDIGTGKLQEGGTFFGRQAYLGMTTPYGSVTFGRQYDSVVDFLRPLSAATVGGGGTFTAHGNDIDNFANTYRTNNAVKYMSPTWRGLTVGGMYSFGGVAGSMTRNSIYSFGASYGAGPYKVAAAYLKVHDPNQSFFGNNTLSSATGNNAGTVTGVQSNPVYSGFASASTYQVIGAGAQYGTSSLIVGANYSNVRFGDLGDPNSGTLSITNPLGYHGTAVFNSYAAYVRYLPKPYIVLTGAYDFLTGGAIDGKPPAHYNQFNAAAHYLLSKRTDLYALATYVIASGTDSTNQPAVASILTVTPSNNAHQLILRLGLMHFF
ncbi:porin [Paraburkholderia sp. Ac-20347]|uniref:porin n=1 Tax=Paraburkholderia sp. Ac-20347 TaxID=2703892 RepID=UPI00197E3406|nr:porin [Paraburkholderia sp. Ac-20347]MBN3807691.1 porin [Paraburkholderia sp. Ac-20347]